MKALSMKWVPGALVGLGLVAASTLAQKPPVARSADDETVPARGTVHYLEKSDVAALREGVLAKMELHVGSTVERGGTIGILNDDMARLSVKKAEVTAKGTAGINEAKAKRALALSIYKRALNLEKRTPGSNSKEEVEKAEADVEVSKALVQQAFEKQDVDKAELKIAEQALNEHRIVAPFPGVITEQKKHPGESVRANEPVVKMANLDRLRVHAFLPLEGAFRIKKNMIADVSPNIEHIDLPAEHKRFRGKVTFVDPEVQLIGEQTRRIFIDIENNADHELEAGMDVNVTIYLNPNSAPPAPTDMLPPQTAEPTASGSGDQPAVKTGAASAGGGNQKTPRPASIR